MVGIYGIPESFQESPEPLEETPVQTPSRVRHSRPTKETVAQRDAEVLSVVRAAGNISRLGVAEKLGLTPHEAYLALSRVSHTGKIRTVRRNNAHVWEPVPDGTTER